MKGRSFESPGSLRRQQPRGGTFDTARKKLARVVRAIPGAFGTRIWT